MKNKIDWNEIAQHLEGGESGEVDKQALEDSQVIWQKSGKLGEKLRQTTYTPDIEIGMAKMYARLNNNSQPTEEDHKIIPLYKKGLFRYAAAAAVIFMLSYVVIQNLPKEEGNLAGQQEVFSNRTASEQAVALADGTQVTLAAGSELTYPKSFDGTTRTVNLKGAAFFDVIRDENKPFMITTKAAHVHVLGTSFNLDAQDDQVELKVKTGKVAFSDHTGNKSFQVSANQSAVYDSKSDKLTKYVNEQSSISWNSNNRIRLADVQLAEITQVLAFRDGLSFTFESEALKTKELAGTINPTDDAGDVLRKLFKAHKELSFVWKDKTIHIKHRS
ncbi:MAG: FecR family protein [Flammeovirgaceae bacterium]